MMIYECLGDALFRKWINGIRRVMKWQNFLINTVGSLWMCYWKNVLFYILSIHLASTSHDRTLKFLHNVNCVNYVS